MSAIWPAVLYALFIWWFSTGIILLADRMKGVSGRGMLIAASVLSIVAVAALVGVRDMATPFGAFVGFTAGLVLWGWHEVSFLSGVVTGPRRGDCPQNARGWKRFVFATQTLIHHELAIAFTALALWLLLAGTANAVGLWTFAILWVMRLSAKLNIFLGVPNVTEEFLPARLAYLKTYFRNRSINGLFPVSITLGTALAFWLGHGALMSGATVFQATSFALLSVLTALAVIEHWFLVLPFRDAALWRWYLEKNNREETKTAAANTSEASLSAHPITGHLAAPETALRRQS